MSRWLPGNLTTMPLGKIDEEISSIESLPMQDRSLADTERLSDLRDIRRRITRGHCGRQG